MKVTLIGTGRVAFHFGHALQRAGHTVEGIVGRNTAHTTTLAADLNVPAFTMNDPLPPCDVIMIAVSDDAISEVATKLPINDAVVIHTSGASELGRLEPHPHRAVLWPVMTLSPGAPADLREVPLVTDANTSHARDVVYALATSLSDMVRALVHEDRELVHAAAAISTNFPLHLLDRAQTLLSERGIDPGLILPCFMAMVEKAGSMGPHDALTGPARRGDLGTVRRHIDRLTHDPELRAAYALISSSILRAYGHPDHEQFDL
jgi:predicted short-subunit dehydrogenase-like oxidoreductase (DUF2520 family)